MPFVLSASYRNFPARCLLRCLCLLIGSGLLLPAAVAQGVAQEEVTQEHPNTERYTQARQLLNGFWLKRRDDPVHLPVDIAELAAYIAHRPAAMSLLQSLQGKALRIRYRSGEIRTRVRASHFSVHSATIEFDPRRAAVFAHNDCASKQACTASPADAFLHELLHARVALLQPGHFLRSARPGSAMYPREHENEILARERELFAAMTTTDAKQRPRRHQHTGRLVSSACVTCVES